MLSGRRLVIAALSPGKWQLGGRRIVLIDGLLSFDVRGSRFTGRTLDGRSEGRNFLDRLFLIAIGAFRLGRVETQSLLLLEVLPATFTMVFIERHPVLPAALLTVPHIIARYCAQNLPATGTCCLLAACS